MEQPRSPGAKENGVAFPKKVGFVGLGAMGHGMAVNLQKEKYEVTGYDVSEFGRQRFEASGGMIASSSINAAKNCELFVVMVANAEQTNSVLFGQQDDGAALCITCLQDRIWQVSS
jgi:3-hydroxyisobutyrate dehydrogenase-like beta-hydroxyacid dehydrogenase